MQQARQLTFADIKRRFPGLKPSRLDYLVREGIVPCFRSGKGKPRLYPTEALEQIEMYLSRVDPKEVSNDKNSSH